MILLKRVEGALGVRRHDDDEGGLKLEPAQRLPL